MVPGLKFFIFLFCLLLLASACSQANAAENDKINENDLFGDSSSIMTENSKPAKDSGSEQEKSIRLSGEITSAFINTEVSVSSVNPLSTYILGNLFLDIRMKKGMKAMANIEASYVGSNKTTLVNIREFFFDFNFSKKVYFRTGKQVLQWGRCYLWNPTDLLNVEKKRFIPKIGYREGAYGIKMHIPYGTKYNIYGFLDTGNVQDRGDAATAGKFEFLLGNTEMAFAGWSKRGFNSVMGYDFSTRLLGIDIMGEASASHGDNYDSMKEEQGVLSIYRSNDWTSRSAVNFGRAFNFGNINDRISVISEFYYNQSGYDGNAFGDSAVYRFGANPLLAGSKRDFIFFNNLYELNNFSKYYGALFASVGRFIVTDMTLNLNYIRNFCDGSGLLSAGIQYKNINDFSYGVLINTPLGNNNSEYTLSNVLYNVQATFGVSF